MNRERLTNLITVLQNVPLEHWNMWQWISTPLEINKSNVLPKLKALECGTTGCAFGWYCACNELPLIDQNYEQTIRNARDHFGIRKDQAEYLFQPLQYVPPIKPHDVILRVRALLEN